MSPTDPVSARAAVIDDAMERALESFEAAWRSGRAPAISAYLAAAGADQARRTALAYELVRLDMEYRWSSRSQVCAAARYKLDDYIGLLAELGPLSAVPVELIAEEYRVRRRWGDAPAADEFLRHYPGRAREIGALLLDVDRELVREVESPLAPLSIEANGLWTADVPQFDYRDFVLEAHLGSGGIGKVYRAWWKSRKAYVAVKMLRKRWWRQTGADELFFREARVLMSLRHDHIVRMHGTGRTGQGGCFLVVDVIDGGDLSRRVNQPAATREALDWVAQAATALHFAHQQGVVHRDVKPSNLLLDRSGKVHVADFGLALCPAAQSRTDGALVGTLAYMAPEQFFDGGRRVGPAADIFSLGAVLYALLTGRPPYDGASMEELLDRRLDDLRRPNQPLSFSALPEAVRPILARCLAAEPAERFSTADDLAASLQRVLGS